MAEIKLLKTGKSIILRNHLTINGEKIKRKTVNLEYWKKNKNVGDLLAPHIFEWMLSRKNIKPDQKTEKTIHLLTVGSILAEGRVPVDATVWGSGLHHFSGVVKLAKYCKVVKLDIRALRGPVTGEVLDFCGYSHPKVWGDPGILMPLIFPCERTVKYECSVIRHYRSADLPQKAGINYIDPRTDDHQKFISEICSSGFVISSSLHGIILAESYGVPAVFLQEGMDEELIKFYDWYYSTNRRDIKIAYSIDEAMRIDPMRLPDLKEMQNDLLDSFPYDLWGI